MIKLPIFPHLGMTEEELGTICEEIFRSDPVIARYLERIEHLAKLASEHDARVHELTKELNGIEGQEDELKAKLKHLDTLRRELHGNIAHTKYHSMLAVTRSTQSEKAIEKRKRQLYLDEAKRRLRLLGKELKLGIGTRSKQGTGIIDIK